MRSLPASSVQSQFYLASQLHTAAALNTITHAWRITGPLVSGRLANAVKAMAERHPTLRSAFNVEGGTVTLQIEDTSPDEPLTIEDASNTHDELVRIVDQLRDLVSPDSVTWKTVLLRHSSEDHTLLFSAHRCIWDETSSHLFAKELSALYSNEGPIDAEGEPAVATQASTSLSADYETGAREFAKSLVNISPLHNFPLKSSRPLAFSTNASCTEVAFQSTMDLVVRAAERLGVAPLLIPVAAALHVLGRYSGQQSLIIGLPFDLRRSSDQLGSHTAILPIGFDTGGTSFDESVLGLSKQYESLRQYANTPFHAIVKEAAARVDSSANPLFQIAFVNEEPATLSLAGCECHSQPLHAPPQQLDVFVQVAPTSFRVNYASHLFASEMIERFSQSVAIFLREALTDPGREASSIGYISNADLKALSETNRTDEPAFLAQDLYDILVRQGRERSDKVAVACAGVSISYASLLASVDVLGARLSRQGIGADCLVGLCLPRSVDMLIALLAVLRCGAAYVPLDPAFPVERLHYMVQHSKLASIITTSKLRDLFGSAPVDFIELDSATDASHNEFALPAKVEPQTPAYVIYTSGSTGNPKGVCVPRGAATNFLLSMLSRPGIRESDTLCAVTTLSFDIAVLELLAPLCAGATIVIATEEEARDPRLLMELLERHRVSILQATPVTWQMLCAANWSGSNALKALCGGEALTPAVARALVPRVAELWNMYGPTETTVWSTCHRIGDPEQPISVGRPIHNTYIYVLDDTQRMLPPGVEGTLYIGGSGVAVGYLFDPELTSRRFLHDPFRGVGRMYNTGDRARISPNGELVILGRSDFQVKLRGFRIELGEIETCIGNLGVIDQVVCDVRREDASQPELVAYYTVKPDGVDPTVAEMRTHCGRTLPSHMVPSRFQKIAAFPRTPNGKVDRKALPQLVSAAAAPAAPAASSMAQSSIERKLLDIWCRVLSIETASINDSFFELGGTSLAAFSVAQEIGQKLGSEISILKIFEHPTIARLAQYLRGSEADNSFIRKSYEKAETRRKSAHSSTACDVAIVGITGRFPGARNVDELWSNLRDGRETVTTYAREELDPLIPEQDRNDPNYIPSRGVLEDTDLFDAPFFGITPNEAELMDPQLRVFMEVAWEAFENAGYVGEHVDGAVGVWAGMGNNFYYHHNVLTRPDKLAIMGEIAAEIANEKDHIAPRVSHKLNLTGPSLSIHTACSTTLVVIENAYQALISGQVDMALAGGVDIRTPQKSGQRFEEGGVFSNDGHCRPFDASATGTMFGEGAGAVVLKRLEDALRDNDTIHAVIKGAAVNHDGGHKVSYLAPSVEGQARVIASALGMAGVSPETITYVEAHGTATPIGDPIEVEALTRVYRAFTQGRRYCAIGSIKGNFGHATTAAGIAGILKVVLAMRHRQIPATLHFKRPNPRIDFASSPFFVNDKLLAWEPRHNLPRRATVSSFGFCGTNAHIVLEEAPKAPESADPSRPFQLFLLSARNPAALDGGVGRMTSALTTMSANSMADAAYTTHVGRKRFECRRCVVLRDPAEAPEFLSQASGARSASLKSDSSNTSVAFVFPGQGAQYINMGRTLYQGEPVFREAIDRCSIELQPHLECDLREYLFPAPGDSERAKQALNNTFYTQPAIFTIGYALASQFMHWGIQPKAFIGHSIGEFLGATVAGVMALEEALRLVATRGRLMQGLPGGSMLTVRLPLDSLLSRLPPDVDVAAVNGPELIVVAGPTQALEAFSQVLASEGIMTRMLHTSHAFHSSMMDPVVEPFLRVVESVKLSAAQLPFVSTVTGDWAKAADVADPNYWAKHLRSPVLFSRAIQVLLADEKQVVLECGPRRTCSTLALQHRPKNPGRIVGVMPDSAEPDDEYPNLLLALGSLWLNGCDVDWAAFHEGESRRRTVLPAYAFQRRRFWIEPGGVQLASVPVAGSSLNRSAIVDQTEQGDERDAPGDPITRAIVGIVEELLGSKVESFDEDARFIMLGLDSLLLTQLARTVRVRLDFEVTFRDLVERYSTTKLLVGAIRAAGGGAAQSTKQPVAPIQPNHDGPIAAEVPMATTDASIITRLDGPVRGAKVGWDADGRLGWYLPDESRPGKYSKVVVQS